MAPGPLICPRPVGPGTAMDGQLLLGLLLLLLGASGLQGQGPGPGGPSEGPPDEEEEQEEEEVPEEDGILVLNRRTLGLALREHPALLVEFCECWGHRGFSHQGPRGLRPALRAHCAPGAPPEDAQGRALGLSWAGVQSSQWGPGAGETCAH